MTYMSKWLDHVDTERPTCLRVVGVTTDLMKESKQVNSGSES